MRASVTEYRVVPVGWLNPAPYNPRVMSDEARERLETGIREFGIVDPLIAREDGLLLGGHQRLTSAIRLGIEKVPCMVISGLTDTEAAALNVLLNNPNAQGQWDMPKLTALLSELDSAGFDTTLTGFSTEELEKLLADAAGEPDLDGLEPEDDRYKEQYAVIVMCGSATEQEATYEKLKGEGFNCKVVVT